MPLFTALTDLVGLAMAAIALAFSLLAAIATVRWRFAQQVRPSGAPKPPVTVLKPLCGAEPLLYDNLRSFCEQDYPEFEIVFGLQHADDPALGIVRRLMAEFPRLTLTTVVDSRAHGSNRKVSNLLNMLEHAQHDVWVIADSDASVAPHYLATVTAPLADHSVGLVTCLYRDVPCNNVWSRLGALYVNDWFMPSVLLAWFLGRRDYVSGQTMCVRRDTMDSIGGFFALRDHLADDYQLGELVRGLGQSIVLCRYVPQAQHYEPGFSSLIHHEIRWMRTIAVLKPGSFRLLFLSFSLPLTMLGCALAAWSPETRIVALATSLGVGLLRVYLHCWSRLGSGNPLLADLWLIPVRDLLTCYVWARGLGASRVFWRGVELRVGSDGVIESAAEQPL